MRHATLLAALTTAMMATVVAMAIAAPADVQEARPCGEDSGPWAKNGTCDVSRFEG